MNSDGQISWLGLDWEVFLSEMMERLPSLFILYRSADGAFVVDVKRQNIQLLNGDQMEAYTRVTQMPAKNFSMHGRQGLFFCLSARNIPELGAPVSTLQSRHCDQPRNGIRTCRYVCRSGGEIFFRAMMEYAVRKLGEGKIPDNLYLYVERDREARPKLRID